MHLGVLQHALKLFWSSNSGALLRRAAVLPFFFFVERSQYNDDLIPSGEAFTDLFGFPVTQSFGHHSRIAIV